MDEKKEEERKEKKNEETNESFSVCMCVTLVCHYLQTPTFFSPKNNDLCNIVRKKKENGQI